MLQLACRTMGCGKVIAKLAVRDSLPRAAPFPEIVTKNFGTKSDYAIIDRRRE
jgi:hypothetical protein